MASGLVVPRRTSCFTSDKSPRRSPRWNGPRRRSKCGYTSFGYSCTKTPSPSDGSLCDTASAASRCTSLESKPFIPVPVPVPVIDADGRCAWLAIGTNFANPIDRDCGPSTASRGARLPSPGRSSAVPSKAAQPRTHRVQRRPRKLGHSPRGHGRCCLQFSPCHCMRRAQAGRPTARPPHGVGQVLRNS